MPVNPADSPILGTLYGSDAMRAVFDERAYFQRMLDVEAALARVQARLGIIPADAAEAITARRARREPGHRGTCRQRPQCRLPGGRPRRRPVARRRRSGRLDALGRHHPGHHGHRHRAPDPRGPGADPRRALRHGRRADRAGRDAPPHGDGRTDAPAAGAADHARPQMRGLGAAADRPYPSPRRAPPARRAGQLRRRGRHAGLARRSGHRGDGGPGRRTGPRRAGRALACQPRRLRRDRRFPRPGLRQPGEARDRCDPAGADRGGRSSRNPMSPAAARRPPCRRSAIRSPASTSSPPPAPCTRWCR